jgi:hypothetical protein
MVEPGDDGVQPIDPPPFAALIDSRSFLRAPIRQSQRG